MADNWYPKAIKKNIAKHVRSRPSGNYPNALVFHVAVSESKSLYSFFRRSAVCSHFYLRKDGTFEQYLPINSRSKSEKDGNYRTISVETQGGVRNANSEKWTDAQVKALAELAAWCHSEHGIPLERMTSSRASARGIGYHRLGVNGNFPNDNLYGGLGQRGGGELWSNSKGKICPGDGKISQIPGIIAKAKGEKPSPSKPSPKPAPKPVSKKGIKEDGFWGRETTRALQKVMGTPVDGEVSSQSRHWERRNPGLTFGWQWVSRPKGSQVIIAMQKKLGVKPDGKIGPKTINALSKRYGIKGDGVLDGPSITIEAMQRALNKGEF